MHECSVKIFIEPAPGLHGRSITISGTAQDIDRAKDMIDERLGALNVFSINLEINVCKRS